MGRPQAVLNPLDYADDPEELEVQRELRKLGIEEEDEPTVCPKCGSELVSCSGMVGESGVYCSSDACSFAWFDDADAIRRVL